MTDKQYVILYRLAGGDCRIWVKRGSRYGGSKTEVIPNHGSEETEITPVHYMTMESLINTGFIEIDTAGEYYQSWRLSNAGHFHIGREIKQRQHREGGSRVVL